MYFRVMGWLAVISTIISVATVYWTDFLHIDLSFLIWFWLGTCLRQGNPTARKWAIAIFLLMSAIVVLALFSPNVKANFGNQKFDRSHPAFYGIMGLVWLVFAVPGITLLSHRGRAAFTKEKEGEIATS